MFKRLLLSASALFALFALAACGTDNTNNSNGSGGSATVISASSIAPSSGGNGTTAQAGTTGGNSSPAAGSTSGASTPMTGSTMAGGTPPANALDADVPSYPGATAVTLPDSLLTAINQSSSSAKNMKYAFYKTTDSPDKIKAFYTDALTKKRLHRQVGSDFGDDGCGRHDGCRYDDARWHTDGRYDRDARHNDARWQHGYDGQCVAPAVSKGDEGRFALGYSRSNRCAAQHSGR